MKLLIKSMAIAALCLSTLLSLCSCKNNSNKKNQKMIEPELPANVRAYANEGFTLYWIGDNAEPRKNPASLFSNVNDEIIEELNIADGIPASMSAFLIKTSDKEYLFDTGMGNENSLLLPSLESIGVAAEDIDAIFITHLHGDHFGGLTKDGNAVFTNAKLYISHDEYDAWIGSGSEKGADAKAAVDPYSERLVLFNFGDELEGGIKAINSVGHTAGHTSYRKGNVLIAGDIMHGVALQTVHPECCASFDMDMEKSVAARISTLKTAESEGLILCGMHFPEGGIIDFRK